MLSDCRGMFTKKNQTSIKNNKREIYASKILHLCLSLPTD